MIIDEVEYMLNAYRQLYEIENKLRLIIKTNMEKQYGLHWKALLHEKRCEQDSFYHELIAFFGKYPQVLPHFNDLQRKKLQSLTPIRNKIAHSHLIDSDEYNLLQECHQLVLKQPIIKRKKLAASLGH